MKGSESHRRCRLHRYCCGRSRSLGWSERTRGFDELVVEMAAKERMKMARPLHRGVQNEQIVVGVGDGSSSSKLQWKLYSI